MLKQRIITAIILIPIVVLLLFYLPPFAFMFLTGFIALGGAWEWTNLMQVQTPIWRAAYLVLVVFMFAFALFIPPAFILFGAFIWWIIAMTMVFLYPRGSDWWRNSIVARGLMGLLVMVPCWAAINYIRNQNDGVYAILFLFVLIWGADSAAYFAGKKWGKTKLAPRVSPGKSFEGMMGALFFSTIIVLAALWIAHTPTSIWIWCVVLGLSTVLFSIIGDLFESMLKRQAGLKDSGSLLPGHGGLLDRIDSLTAAAPIFAFGAWILGMYLS